MTADAHACIRRNERILLRHAVEEDRGEFIALRQASGRFLTRWEPLPREDPQGLGPEEVAFNRFIEFDQDRRVPMLLVGCEDQSLLGAININEISRGAFQSCALGWWIGSEHAGRGYMREGLTAALEHVFIDLELHRAEANIQPNNEPSLKLARHVRMRREGFSERYLRIDGTWSDHERWAITVEDWHDHRGVDGGL